MVAVRFLIGVCVFLSTFICYTFRVNVAISIIGMVDRQKKAFVPYCDKEKMDKAPTTPAPAAGDAPATTTAAPSGKKKEKLFDWNEHVQGLVLSSFSYGYFLTSMPGGPIAEYFGPYPTLFLINLISTIFNSVSAILLYLTDHWSTMFVCRFIMGMAQGIVYPAVQVLIARWAPPAEKGKFVAAMMGNTLGTTITFPLVGWATAKFGWQIGFHTVTIMGIIYCVIFFFVAASSPAEHRWISEEEKQFILDAQAGTVSGKKKAPPYMKLFKSLPFWALVVAQFGNLWGLFLLVAVIPKFFAEILGFDLKESGVLSSLPFIARLIMGFMFGAVGDYLRKSGKFPKTCLRKFFIIFSHFVPGICFLAITMFGCNAIGSIGSIIILQGINGAAVETTIQNPHDLAPNYAGSIYGVANFIGGSSGFLGPVVTAAFIAKNNGMKEWGYNFYLGAGIYFLTGLFFVLFGSGELQPFNDE